MNRELIDEGVNEAHEGQRSRLKLSEIDLMDFLHDVWGAKRSIATLLVLSVFLSLFSVWAAKPTYTAKMLVGPSEQSGDQGGIGGAPGQLGGAASMLGINGGGGLNSAFRKYEAVLDSYDLAAAILRHDELKTMIFGPSWNPSTRTWSRPTGFTFEVKDFLKGLLGLQRWAPPTPFTMQMKIKTMMKVTTNKLTSYLTISLDADTAEQAQKLLTVITKGADDLLCRSQKGYSQNRIDYLNFELQRATQQDQRAAMIQILSVQEQRLMMASADKTVAIDIIDAPYAPPLPSAPQPRVVLVTYAFYAAVLGILIALVHGARQRRRKVHPARTTDQAAYAWVRRYI